MESNAGKPIFVFWSLLAIPTLTILISNMGDTVIKGIRDLTLWFGEFTILPGEGSTKEKLQKGATAIREGQIKDGLKQQLKNKKANRDDDLVPEAPGGVFLAENRRHKGGEPKKPEHIAAAAATDRLGEEYEAEELDAATRAHEKGDGLSGDVHLYHYLLVREIRNVMKDLDEEPPKKYSYHEWAWFMRLLGEDENDSKFHSKPSDDAEATQGNDNSKETSNEASHLQKGNKDSNDRTPGDGGKSTGWSWVGINSPLLGTDEEAEWVLERLSEKLEKELKLQSQRQKTGKPEAEPPVTHGSREQQHAPEEPEEKKKI